MFYRDGMNVLQCAATAAAVIESLKLMVRMLMVGEPSQNGEITQNGGPGAMCWDGEFYGCAMRMARFPTTNNTMFYYLRFNQCPTDATPMEYKFYLALLSVLMQPWFYYTMVVIMCTIVNYVQYRVLGSFLKSLPTIMAWFTRTLRVPSWFRGDVYIGPYCGFIMSLITGLWIEDDCPVADQIKVEHYYAPFVVVELQRGCARYTFSLMRWAFLPSRLIRHMPLCFSARNGVHVDGSIWLNDGNVVCVRFGHVTDTLQFPIAVFNIISNVCLTKKDLYAPDVKTVMESEPVRAIYREMNLPPPSVDMYCVLTSMWAAIPSQLAKFGVLLSNSTPVVPRHNYGVDTSFDGVKPAAHIIGPSFCDSYVPWRSRLNDKCCVDERIIAVANGNKPVSEIYYGYAREYAHLLLNGETCVPISVADVLKLQNRPSQLQPALRDLPIAVFNSGKIIVSSFQKVEAYAALAPPRNISTTPPDFRVCYSRYTYPIAEVLKKTHWYAFGLQPEVLCQRVHDRSVHGVTAWLATDYSKFDGSRHVFFNYLEKQVLQLAYPDDKEPLELLERQYDSKARTSCGVGYNVGSSRLSGSPDTSIGNSMDNSFIAYAVARDSGLLPTEAWDSLGFYGGDDGITPVGEGDPVVVATTYTNFVRDTFGMSLKMDVVRRGQDRPFVPFLGRLFENPWGGPGFMCDIVRQMRKLHISCASNDVPLPRAAVEKALGVLVSEYNTPIIGEYCRAILRVYPPVNVDERSVLEHTSYIVRTMGVFPEPHDMLAMAAQQLGWYGADLLEVCAKLDSVETLKDFMELELPTLPVLRPKLLQPVLQGGFINPTLVVPAEGLPPDNKDTAQSVVYAASAARAFRNRERNRRGRNKHNGAPHPLNSHKQ